MVPRLLHPSVIPFAVDLPDEPDARVPEFKSRRKAAMLPPIRPATLASVFAIFALIVIARD